MNLSSFCLIASFVVSLLCGLIFIPMIVSFCIKKKLYDIPNARKVHKHVVPRLGGVCFMPCMVISVLLAMAFFNNTSFSLKFSINLWACYFFMGLLFIYAVGLIDDLVGVLPRTKFLVQIFAASLLPMANLYINNLYGFCGIYELPFYIGAPLTVFVIVFIDNAMNLIDGIDGLSSGLSVVALAGFLYCFLREGILVYGILIAGLLGVLIAFMYFNLFGKPGKTKIFMGDSGSLTIGFVLGVLFVKFSMDNPDVIPFRRDSMLLVYTLLIVPVYDVVRVIIVRLFHHKPLFGADKNHIHHKLLRAGMTQHQALVSIIGISLFFIFVNYSLVKFIYVSTIVLIDIMLWFAIHEVINCLIRKRGNTVFFVSNSEEPAK